jgi:hypothetical protein
MTTLSVHAGFGHNNTGLQAGYIASVNAEFHSHAPGKSSRQCCKSPTVALTADLTLEPPETPPNPLSTVPFRHDPDYVQRGSLVEEIDSKLSQPAARVALVGLGGVG